MYLSRVLDAWRLTLEQGLPLFRREMLVQSYRPRTYVIRALFAVTLFFVAIIYTAVVTQSSLLTSAVRLPGQGRVILDALVWMLFVFIYVFAPATASGVITLEKERQTLVLLFLTKLTAWHVILEKFLSRLLPTLSILLLAMPLLVISYTFGGVTSEMLVTSMWFLFVTAVQVTAVAVLCSTLSRRTTQAFLFTYGVLLLLYFGPVLADIWLLDGRIMKAYFARNDGPIAYAAPAIPGLATPGANTSLSTNAPGVAIPKDIILLACFPPTVFAYHYEPSRLGSSFAWANMFLAGYPTLLSALVSLLLARFFVYFRAFEDQRTPGLQDLQKFLARFRMSHVATRQREAVLDHIPSDEPIAWRESFRTSGNWLPFLLALEIPTLTAILWLARTGDGQSESISAVIFVLWAVGILLICVHASSLLTKERSRQTLDLLLTTPLTSADIIQQKFNGTRRLMLVCAAPLLTCIVFQAWWRTILEAPNAAGVVIPNANASFIWWEYLITAGSCVVIYFQLAAWIALWAGLRNKSPVRATLDALGGVAFCCLVPQVLLLLPLAILIPANLLFGFNLVYLVAAQLSPVLMIILAEYANLRELCSIPLLPTITNSVIYCGLLYWCRRYVLDRADVLLGRTVHY